jgi:hypothetical protein
MPVLCQMLPGPACPAGRAHLPHAWRAGWRSRRRGLHPARFCVMLASPLYERWARCGLGFFAGSRPPSSRSSLLGVATGRSAVTPRPGAPVRRGLLPTAMFRLDYSATLGSSTGAAPPETARGRAATVRAWAAPRAATAAPSLRAPGLALDQDGRSSTAAARSSFRWCDEAVGRFGWMTDRVFRRAGSARATPDPS